VNVTFVGRGCDDDSGNSSRRDEDDKAAAGGHQELVDGVNGMHISDAELENSASALMSDELSGLGALSDPYA
jgi:hypothetical protein